MNLFTRFGTKIDRALAATAEATSNAKRNFKVGFEVGKLVENDPIVQARLNTLAEQARLRVEQAEVERAAAKYAEHQQALIQRKLDRLEQLRNEALSLCDELAKLGVETL